jgi:translocation and assembly module TamB
MFRKVVFALFGFVVLVFAAVASLFLHSHLAIGREAIADAVTRELESVFVGQIRIDDLDGIGPGGVTGLHATVFDPEGVVVLVVDRADAEISLSALVWRPLVIDRVHVRGANIRVDENADGQLRLARAFEPRNKSGGRSTLELDIPAIEVGRVSAHGRIGAQVIDADVLDARASLRVRPAGVTIAAAADAVAHGLPHGVDPRVHAEARLKLADRVRVRGRATGASRELAFGAEGSIDGDAIETNLEAKGSIPEIPDTIDVHASARGTIDVFRVRAEGHVGEGRVRASARRAHDVIDGRLEARSIELHAFVPQIRAKDVAADLSFHGRGKSFQVRGSIDPRGAHATVEAAIDPRTVRGEADVVITDVGALASPFDRAKHTGSGTLHASGAWDRQTKLVSAEVHSSFDGASRDDIRIERLGIDASADGPIADPHVVAHARALGIAIPKVHVAAIQLDADGRLSDSDVRVSVVAKEAFDAKANVGIDANRVRIDNLEVSQEGAPLLRGLVHWDGAKARIAANAEGIDLGRVAKALGSAVPIEGRVGLATDATVGADSLQGFVTIGAQHVVWDRIHDAGGHLEVSASGNRFAASLRGHRAGGEWIALDAEDLRPRGSPFSIDAWGRAAGHARVDALADFEHGRARIALALDKPKSERPPSIRFDAKTEGIYGRKGDLDFAGTIEDTGRLAMHANVRAGKGVIGTIDLGATVPWEAIASGAIPTTDALLALPVTLDANMPEGDAHPICDIFGVSCRGRASLSAHVEGPIQKARGSLRASVADFHSSVSPVSGPLDASAAATYEPGSGKVDVRASVAKDQTLDLSALVHVPDGLAGWYATIDLDAKNFPLRSPIEVGADRVKAKVSGTVHLADWRRDARLAADLHAADLDAGGVVSDKVDIEAGYDGAALGTKIHIAAKDGGIDFEATAKAGWGSALSPKLDETQPIEATVAAKRFRLKTLSPIVPHELGEIDGTLDADVKASFTRSSKALAVQGFALVNKGAIGATPIGELNDISARVVAQPDGSIVLDEAHLRGSSGWVDLRGSGHIANGKLASAELAANIKRSDPFPVVIEGEHIGELWGNATSKLTPRENDYEVVVDVPRAHLVMPSTSQRALQSLDPESRVAIGVRDKTGAFQPVATGAPRQRGPAGPPIAMDVELGREVVLEEGQRLKVFVRGTPHVELSPAPRVTGHVRVTRGTVDVSGKRFDIESGLVTFTGDPANPTVIASAFWKAPDGSYVYADYSGPVKSGKIALRSEPPHTRDEIVALLVFGTTQGPATSAATASTTTAIGTVGGIATEPLNKALDQLTHLDIRTRLDTSYSNPRPELEVQLHRDISAQVAYVVGQPPPGTNPDKYFFTLRWRISSKWTTDATVGNLGSSIFELTWHHRY